MAKGLPKSIIKKYGITKKAWRIFRGRKPKSRSKRTTKRKSNPKRRRRRNPMARRRRRRSRSFLNTGTIFRLFRIGALIAPGVSKAVEIGGAQGVVGAFGEYGGINAYTKQFDWNSLARAWTPFFAVSLVTYGIPKLMGMIRRL